LRLYRPGRGGGCRSAPVLTGLASTSPGADRRRVTAWAWVLVACAAHSITDPGEVACYVCYGPRRSTQLDLAWIA
jgi:hypothetical protein